MGIPCRPVFVAVDIIYLLEKKNTYLRGAGDAASEIVQLFSNKHDGYMRRIQR